MLWHFKLRAWLCCFSFCISPSYRRPHPAVYTFLPACQVFETDHGTLRNVLAAIKRGRLMKCSHCGRRGATLGCRVPSCACRCGWEAEGDGCTLLTPLSRSA